MKAFILLAAVLLPLSVAQTPRLPVGYRAEAVVIGLSGPTQMTFGPDGQFYVAQLAGGENSGTGEVLRIDLATGEQETLLQDLYKPTGLAVTATDLWVMAGNRLLRAPLTETGAGRPEAVLQDLPNNGRSEGTLTLTPDGGLLYETSGALGANGPQPNSGVLWRLELADPADPEPLATGLKGAYGHVFAPDGTLYTTEIGDDWVGGGPPPDELNVVSAGADYGWPRCYGRGRAAREYGGTAADCAETERPLALFTRDATPTSVAVSPFNQDELVVALWVPSQVVRVDAESGEVTPFLTGVQLPQHLLADGDTLLVSGLAAGTIYRVSQAD